MRTMAAVSTSLFILSAILSLCLPLHDHLVGASFVQNTNVAVTNFVKLSLPPSAETFGSLTFDALGRGPYAGTTDGRIFRYSRLSNSWEQYGYTSPNRNQTFCDAAPPVYFPACGATAGLSFAPLTQSLYACDAFKGLAKLVGRGEATILVRNSDALPPFRFPNSVDAASDGYVYFVDTSAVYDPSESAISRQTGDSTGRLLRYNPLTRGLKTLLSNLGRASGVAASFDASFLLVSEANKNRVQKYFLRGTKAGTSEIFLTFEGSPNKIKRNQEGNFWIAVTNVRDGVSLPQGVKVSPSGQILAVVDLSKEYRIRVNSVVQQGRELFVAANNLTYVGRYQIV